MEFGIKITAPLKLLFILSSFIVIPVIVKGQQFFNGACPNPTPILNFDRVQYSKIWYLIEKYQSTVGHAFSCVVVQYFPPAADGTWKGAQNFTERKTGIVFTIPAVVSFLSTDGSAYFNGDSFLSIPSNVAGAISFQPRPWDLALTLQYPYWVLATDYTTYAVEWTCISLGNRNFQFLWIFSSTNQLPSVTLQEIRNTLTEKGINVDLLAVYDTTGCNFVN